MKDAPRTSPQLDGTEQTVSTAKPSANSSTGFARFWRVTRDSGHLWAATLILDQILPISLMRFWRPKNIPVDLLREQIEVILRAWGMSQNHAKITTELILYSDLHGIDSHGCNMLPGYHRDYLSGRLNMTPSVAVIRETETTTLIDGGGGLGHVPAKMAMEMAIEKCRNGGLAAAAVRNSGHYGAAGAYAAMAAREGLIGIATTSTHSPSVVPTFAAEKMLGTNPIAFAAPTARRPPFLLDMATSTVPIGKLIIAWRNGRSIPAGWALNPRGRAVKDGRVASKHRLLTPLGGTHEMGSHKGYGLATMVEILSSVLPGVQSGRQSSGMKKGVGHFFLALNPQFFRELAEFKSDLDELIDGLHACKRADRTQPVLVAGDPERAAFLERSKSGIPLSRSLFEDIRSIALVSNVSFYLDQKA